jgi:predicted GIY-YIG superfamily endonuclease
MSTKTCRACKQDKPIECFNKDKSRPDGKCPRCKACDLVAVTKWKEKNIEKKLAYDTQFYYKNRAKVDKQVMNNHFSIDPAIYMIKNIVNGKCYIGTSSSPYRRVYQHLSYREDLYGTYPSTFQLASDVEKYGKEAFVWGVMEHTTKENKFERERYYINQYQPEYNNRK